MKDGGQVMEAIVKEMLDQAAGEEEPSQAEVREFLAGLGIELPATTEDIEGAAPRPEFTPVQTIELLDQALLAGSHPVLGRSRQMLSGGV